MDVKSAFLKRLLNEEVYVHKTPGFENSNKPNHVFKLAKALYGLKQAPRAWYERLYTFLIKNNFSSGKLIQHFLEKMINQIFLLSIYMLMTLSLDLSYPNF